MVAMVRGVEWPHQAFVPKGDKTRFIYVDVFKVSHFKVLILNLSLLISLQDRIRIYQNK